MTQADSALALRRSLDPESTHGQGQAEKITAKTPLPAGWASFCSKADENSPSHWYATPPWDVYAIKEELGQEARALEHTVTAKSWTRLHLEVQAQVRLYEHLTRE